MENYKDWLHKKVKVRIDEPLGSAHPEFTQTIMRVNYGFVPGTRSSADNQEIDAYVLGVDKPLKEFEGEVIAVVQRKKDGELKLIVSDGQNYAIPEIEKIINFREKYQPHKIFV